MRDSNNGTDYVTKAEVIKRVELTINPQPSSRIRELEIERLQIEAEEKPKSKT